MLRQQGQGPLVYLHGGPGSGATPASGGSSTRRCTAPSCSTSAGAGAAAAGQRARRRSEREHDRAPRRRHRAAARAPRSREVDSLRCRWGTTLGLAYAQASATGRRAGAGPVTDLPREVAWSRRGAHLPGGVGTVRRRGPRGVAAPLVDAYAELLFDPDPAVRDHAAREWCAWEDHTSRSPRAIAATRASTTTPSSASGSHGWSRTTGGTPLSSRRIS